MERDERNESGPHSQGHFNSHAHVERDLQLLQSLWSTIISTHTLTWSVTNCVENVNYIIDISTHTLTWSVTIFEQLYGIINAISTHTLTWSVTQLAVANVKWFKHFNSHAHVERDVLMTA